MATTKKKADPDPICEREELVYRVTSMPDGEKWSEGKGIRSAWVCGDRACVLDAMAWVTRGGFDKVYVYDNDRREVHP